MKKHERDTLRMQEEVREAQKAGQEIYYEGLHNSQTPKSCVCRHSKTQHRHYAGELGACKQCPCFLYAYDPPREMPKAMDIHIVTPNVPNFRTARLIYEAARCEVERATTRNPWRKFTLGLRAKRLRVKARDEAIRVTVDPNHMSFKHKPYKRTLWMRLTRRYRWF